MKTNITRPVDREYGYDLEIEVSISRDGIACHGYINGDCKVVKFGPEAETEVRVHLYRAVTWELNSGAADAYAEYNAAEPVDESPYGELVATPTSHAALVEAREQAYIAQRDAERELTRIKDLLTASIAADPAYKNDVTRKAELAARLGDYPITVEAAQTTTDAYRKALAAIEVYQEAAKDQRARLRHETAQMELKAAELQLQAAQAKQTPVVADMPHQKPDAIKDDGIVPNFETQHPWELQDWQELTISEESGGDSAGYIAKCVYLGRVCNDLIIREDGEVVVFENEGDCQDYCFAMRDRVGYGEWSPRKVWYERPF